MNIAIDGPAGAGKSTIAKKVAAELGSVYVDTGAMYRAMTLYMLEHDIDPKDGEAVGEACIDCDITLRYEDGTQHVYLNGEDVSSEIRQERVGKAASFVSKVPRVREKLVELQRKLAEETSVVMDGRDIGTVVLPNAELKIYLTADPHVRAKRRHKELVEKLGEASVPDYLEIEKDIIKRDHEDMTRKISPLKKADDAIVLDSSDLTIDEVCEKILSLASQTEEMS